MEEWKEYKLNDVCEVINGRAYKQEELLEEGKYRVLRVGNIFQGNNWYYSDIELPEDKYCYNGDLLYAWSCGFAPYIWKGEKTIYHYHIWKLKENKEVVDRKFLYFYLIVNTKRFLGGTHGSVMLHLTKREMEEQLLKLPSLETQRRIASILSSLDDKIEVNRKINENLEQQAQALFKSWFVDFEPFKDGEFVESELGMIPKGWRVGTFLDNINVMPGGTPSTSKNEYWENGTIPFFSPKDINGVYCFVTEKSVTDLGLKNCSSHLYPKDTLFITARGTVGKLTLAGVPMAMNQSNYALVAKEGVSKFYLFLLAQTLVSILLKKANGAVFSAITTRDFNEPTIIPKTSNIEQFDKLVSPIFNKIYQTSYESRRLATLRDTILPKLMSGELKVNEIKE